MSTQVDIPEELGFFLGEDKDLVYNIVNQTTLLAENLSGWTLRWELSLAKFGTRVFQKATGGSGIVLTDAPGGVVTVSIASADTVDLLPGVYYYTLRRTNAGEFAEIAYGEIALLDTWTEYT